MATLASIISLDPAHKLLGQTNAEQKTPTVSCSTSSLTPPSTFNAVPIEILVEIFELCQSNGFHDDPSVPSLSRISSVCQRWRAVTMAAPHLWAKIALWNPQETHELMVKQWLERSQGCPLTLAIRHSASEPSVGWDVVAKSTGQIFALFLRHIHRWRSLTMSTNKIILLPDILPIVEEAPLLVHVDISNKELHIHPSAVSFWKSLFSQSSLRRVRCHGPIPEWKGYPPSMADCHWERLTHISGHFVVDDIFVDALSRCQGLEELELSKLTASDTAILLPHLCVLSRLCVLKLRCRDTAAAQLVSQLVVPNLRRLDVNLGQGYLASWVDLFDRSRCVLDTLRLWIEEPLLETDFIQFLSLPSLSRLTELEAAMRPLSTFVVQTLTRESDDMRLPLLQHLSLLLKDCPDGLSAAMVKSRISYSGFALRHVYINNFTGEPRDTPSSDSHFFQQLRSTGFDAVYLGE
ncbi:hypothetical protein Moror_17021 [Moniliophthora roreri MCA 2997]|uniref:F-box domain-containing protein n=2 Tax=Moniliophthora roreri TaxID=221103 RepID=V2WRH2_MONRO|nr:hypothetical protein Moror_17021 [Moniliophthora roreri MCA 2997]KAI3608721.1 hypothetical protein WG66_003861 [Moniliophthora roreri]